MKYLIVGLGNIGAEYHETRHNIGFMVLDAFAKASNIHFEDKRYGFVAETTLKGRKIFLLKPTTFMNLSGNAVRYWLNQDKIDQSRLLVISDEIHADMALFGHKHIPFASVSDKARNISITFQAPSKTFNIAGIVSSYAIIPNEDIRNRFYKWLSANELDEPTLFAPIATIAAFRKGEEWRKAMLAYIEDNIRFVEDYCREHIPGIRPLRPQASFLVWLNCRDLYLSHDALLDLFIDKAHLALNDGEMFGPGGEGFMRLNVAAPRSIIKQALQQLEEAVSQL